MDWRDFLGIWRPIWSFLTVFAIWGLWSLKKLTASKEDLRHIENRLNNHDKLLALFEEKCASRADLHRLALRISAVKSTQKAQNEQLNAINESVRRIESYLLEHHK